LRGNLEILRGNLEILRGNLEILRGNQRNWGRVVGPPPPVPSLP